MRVLDIVPKDVIIRFELSLGEVQCITKALDYCTIGDSVDDDEAKALETLNKMFADVSKGLENATI